MAKQLCFVRIKEGSIWSGIVELFDIWNRDDGIAKQLCFERIKEGSVYTVG
jgi:hypothetical protein